MENCTHIQIEKKIYEGIFFGVEVSLAENSVSYNCVIYTSHCIVLNLMWKSHVNQIIFSNSFYASDKSTFRNNSNYKTYIITTYVRINSTFKKPRHLGLFFTLSQNLHR